jgi:hypothetical protein
MDDALKTCWKLLMAYVAIAIVLSGMVLIYHHVDMHRRAMQQNIEVTK